TGGRFVITTTAKPAFTPYIQSVKLNGDVHRKNWISIRALTAGGRLSFTLGKSPSRNWGAKPNDAPPSLSNGSR
ncbi:MAG: glycoside hydrolase domain-containing protein, partial [Phycisphaerae bacterium]